MENQNMQERTLTPEEAQHINQAIRMEIGNLTMKVIQLEAKNKALEAENQRLKAEQGNDSQNTGD